MSTEELEARAYAGALAERYELRDDIENEAAFKFVLTLLALAYSDGVLTGMERARRALGFKARGS